MSYISDFKSGPFDIFSPSATNTSGGLYNGYTGTGLNSVPDYGLDSLLGSKWQTADGRTLQLVSNAAVALVPGVLVQSQAETTAHQKLAVAAAAAVGTFTVSVTNSSTVMNINQYAGGFLIVDGGSAILGQTLKIASHTAGTNAGTVTVTLEDPIQIALTTSCTVSFLDNQFQNVIITPATTATGSIVGATIYPMPASTAPTYNATSGALVTAGTPQYGYVVSNGYTGILVDNSITNIGYPVGVSKVTAGSVGIATLTSTPQIGTAAQTLTSAHTGLIKLSL